MKHALITIIFLLTLPVLALAGRATSINVTAQNTGTTALVIHNHGTVRISGTFVATVSLQRSEDGGTTWKDTGDTWTTPGVYTFSDYTGQTYRAWVETGNFTSGTVCLWIGDSQ